MQLRVKRSSAAFTCPFSCSSVSASASVDLSCCNIRCTHVTLGLIAPKSRDTRLHLPRQLLVRCTLLLQVPPAVIVRPLCLPLLLLHMRVKSHARATAHAQTQTHLQLLQRFLQLGIAGVGCSHGRSLLSAVAVAGGARVLQTTLALVHFLRSV